MSFVNHRNLNYFYDSDVFDVFGYFFNPVDNQIEVKNDFSLEVSSFNFSNIDLCNINSWNLNNGHKYSLWRSSKLFTDKNRTSKRFDYNQCNFIYGIQRILEIETYYPV